MCEGMMFTTKLPALLASLHLHRLQSIQSVKEKGSWSLIVRDCVTHENGIKIASFCSLKPFSKVSLSQTNFRQSEFVTRVASFAPRSNIPPRVVGTSSMAASPSRTPRHQPWTRFLFAANKNLPNPFVRKSAF